MKAIRAILDEWLPLTTARQTFSADEVQNLLLDLRNLTNPKPKRAPKKAATDD